jgi:hypothetical protein
MIKQQQEDINRIERKLNNLLTMVKGKTGFDNEEGRRERIRETPGQT